MSERIRIRPRLGTQQTGQTPQQNRPPIGQTPEEVRARKEAEEQLRKNIDAVLSEYQTGTAPIGQGEVVGHHPPHQVVRPLSDEEVVRNFRQTTGE